jgi:hypothetical protein
MLRIARSTLIAATLALTAAPSLAAQASTQESAEPTELPAVEVTAQNLREVVQTFVADVSEVHERNGQIARFDTRICPGVVNLPAESAQIINDQIARAANWAGRAVGGPGCAPNVLVIFTDDSDRLANDLADAHPSAFAFYAALNQNAESALTAFRAPGQIVRTWYLARESTGIEQAFRIGRPRGTFAVRAPIGLYPNSGRLSAAHETVITRSLIIVDTRLLGPVNVQALGDYLSMISLARIDTAAPTAHLDTILNLFSEPEGVRPKGLSSWDKAYLQSLYSARPNSATTNFHVRDIADRMTRRISGAQ